jgi:ABC-type nitrate/sulfonate/bicarbonate transport system substrate-binding protein
MPNNLRALALIALAAASTANAQALRVMGFAGSSNWPMFVAQEKGFFTRERVEVQLSDASSSAVQIAQLRDGRIDIAMTAMDNLVPYGDELFAFLGVNNGGRSSLIVAPSVKRYGDLRSRPLAVDAIDSGYAFVLMEMLERAGLAPGDYQLLSVGSSRERFGALREGKAAGALLNAPIDAAAEAAGFTRLATSAEVVTHYQGSVGAARRQWGAANADTLVRYIRAYVQAVDWLYEPANRAEAIAVLQRHAGSQGAERSYEEFVTQRTLARRAVIDVEGVREVLRLRARFARPAKPLGEPARYYDLGYYERALRP